MDRIENNSYYILGNMEINNTFITIKSNTLFSFDPDDIYINCLHSCINIVGIEIPLYEQFNDLQIIYKHTTSFGDHYPNFITCEIPYVIIELLSKVISKQTKLLVLPEKLLGKDNDMAGIPLCLFSNLKITASSDYELRVHFKIIKKTSMISPIFRANTLVSMLFINESIIKIKSNELCSGFFVECDKDIENISLAINNLVMFDYNEDSMIFACTMYDNVARKMEYDEVIYRSLCDILPPEMICHIKNYLSYPTTKTIWIPIESGSNWDKSRSEIVDFGKTTNITVTFDKEYTGTIYLLHHRPICL